MTEDERTYQAENAAQFDDDLLEAVEKHEPDSTGDAARAVGRDQQIATRRPKPFERREGFSSNHARPALRRGRT